CAADTNRDRLKLTPGGPRSFAHPYFCWIMTKVSTRLLVICLLLAGVQLAQQVDDSFFAGKLYPILEKAECRMCHNDNGVSSATRLQFPSPEAKPEAIRIFGLKLSALIDRADIAKSPLLNKPTQRVPHTGGERIRK